VKNGGKSGSPSPSTTGWETLATVSLDLAAARLHVHAGGPLRDRAGAAAAGK
jgi:hypothetical protein